MVATAALTYACSRCVLPLSVRVLRFGAEGTVCLSSSWRGLLTFGVGTVRLDRLILASLVVTHRGDWHWKNMPWPPYSIARDWARKSQYALPSRILV